MRIYKRKKVHPKPRYDYAISIKFKEKSKKKRCRPIQKKKTRVKELRGSVTKENFNKQRFGNGNKRAKDLKNQRAIMR